MTLIGNPQMTSKATSLFLVELHFQGLGKAISKSPEERVLTTIFRLAKEDKNKLQYLKVRFYRLLDKHSLFKLRNSYVVPRNSLIEIEKEFQAIYREFTSLRDEIYARLNTDWDEISLKLKSYATKFDIPPNRIDALKPSNPHLFLNMNYTITPLPSLLSQIYHSAEEFEKLGEQVKAYQLLAQRVKREAEEIKLELKQHYEERIAYLNETIKTLKKALKAKSKEAYKLRLHAKNMADEASEIANLIGEDAVLDLQTRLEALKEYFVANNNGNGDTQVSKGKSLSETNGNLKR